MTEKLQKSKNERRGEIALALAIFGLFASMADMTQGNGMDLFGLL